MSDNTAQWVVRLPNEQVKGPYTTEALRNMIISGAFNGSEEVCPYPQGEWQPLTKQTEFYDALLDSLENPAEYDARNAQKMEAETVVRSKPNKPSVEKEIPKFDIKEFVDQQNKEDADLKTRMEGGKSIESSEKKEPLLPNLGKTIESVQSKALARHQNALAKQNEIALRNPAAFPAVKTPEDIQMTDLKQLKKKEVKKASPFIFVAVLLVIAAVALILMDEEAELKSTSWTLLAPEKNPANQESLTAEQITNMKRLAVSAFQRAHFEDLLQSQKGLVKVIEASERDLEAMGLLCMAHQQLWPFTKQTQQDLRSTLAVVQRARTINPISSFSDTCQVAYLLQKGQTKEAKSLVEKTLDNPVEEKFSLGPFLYFIKAEMLEYETSFTNAEAYYDQAVKLWPQWITARFGLARMQYKLNKLSEARANFEQILKEQPDSKIGSYGLGLIENRTTKNEEKTLSYFANGFKSKQRMLKDFQAEALLNYAKILMNKNDTKLALEVAQEGYRISPGNRDLRDLVIALGGDEKVEGANSELVLIGDQFARAGDFLTAQAQYKAAFDMDPQNGMAAYKAAKSLWNINQTRDAINWLDKAIQADPKLLQAYVLKADFESQRYNFTAAARTLAVASSRLSQSHEITKALAQLEFRKNNMYAAIQYGERALAIYDADVELLTMLAQAHIFVYENAPTNKKEDVDRKQKAKDLAKRYAGRAIDLEPAWPESQITYSKMLASLDGPVRGETYLKELIKAYPYTLEYRIALAEFYKFNEKYSESAKQYEEVVSIDPKNKKASFGLAESYRILGKPDLAQKYYNITSALDPSDVEAMFANAKLLIETASGREVRAKNEQALAKLELVKKINPEFPKVSFFMARCYMELNNYPKALEMAREEKTRNPSIADSYLLAAEIYYRQGLFKECAVEYSSAIRLRPTSAELYVKASICYRNSEAIDIAEDMLEMARERENGNAELHRELGYINLRKAQPAAALLSFQKYLILSPNATDRAAVADEIKKLGGEVPQ